MAKNGYGKFNSNKMILRDHLALERTALANERTLLSYVRSMIGLIAVGGTVLKFFDGFFYLVTGWILICMAGIILIIGFIRYLKTEIILYGITHDKMSEIQEDRMHYFIYIILAKLHLIKEDL